MSLKRVAGALNFMVRKANSSILSPRVVTGVGILIAVVQLATAIDQWSSSRSKKRIGFDG